MKKLEEYEDPKHRNRRKIERRRERLDEAAKAAGFESWSKAETAVLNGTAVIRKVKMNDTGFYSFSKLTIDGFYVGVAAPNNSHGCMDYFIAMINSPNKTLEALGLLQDYSFNDNSHATIELEVVEAQSCHSCWQVGHDADHVFAQVGEKFTMRLSALRKADQEVWAKGVMWEADPSSVVRNQ